MRKTVLIMILILVAVFAMLNALDHGDYPVEKKVWQVQKKSEILARDTSAVPDQEFDQLIDQYRSIIQQYPRSRLVPKISLMIGRIYGLKKDYPKAREVYRDIIKDHPRDPELQSEALRNMAMTYEIEKDSAQAIKVYQMIMTNHPLTDIGLNIPLYLAKYYKELGRDNEFEAALDEAVVIYQMIAEEEPESAAGFKARSLLVTAYLAKRQWSSAVQVMEDLLLNFSGRPFMTAVRLQGIVKSINTLCVGNLKDIQKPLRIYQSFLEKYPRHSAVPFVKGMIEGLTSLKEQSPTGVGEEGAE